MPGASGYIAAAMPPSHDAHAMTARTSDHVLIVDDAGHYPHTQQPEVVNPAVIAFLTSLGLHA